ncbi:MAG TPA: GH1 family beta-glucosidase [Caproiciproducens sp.]|nr:GH1 family beta-glucosidase [Caproiciproducens sp.]
MSFSKDFIWGTATASYQIEGAPHEDGKSDSIWDEFCRIPGATFHGQTGDTACDHYHRFREDIALMKQLGIRSYRFSFSWPRILPHGIGKINEAGIRFYEELVDELIKNQITPYATLFHWDYPAVLQKQGGWLNPQSPVWFEYYAKQVAARFAGKIKHYFTLNEPQCIVGLGYSRGEHAPGLRLSAKDCFTAAHHILLAHGRAVRALRESGGDGLEIGIAQNGRIAIPRTESPDDIEAARRATFEIPDRCEDALFSVSFWSDPVFKGEYPKEFLEKYRNVLPDIRPGDMAVIHQPIEFYAQNIYNSNPVEAYGGGWRFSELPLGNPKTAIGWPITPSCTYWSSRYLYERYQSPVLISENGMSAHDAVSLDGRVHDPNRIDYLHRHLLSLRHAVEKGVPVKGYFAWSLLDNFEWASAYNDRFGLVFVDYRTQERIPKDSAYWYQSVIAANGKNL